MSNSKSYVLRFRSKAYSYPGGKIECVGANFVNIYLQPSHVAAGVTINGIAGYAGINEFKCPTPDGELAEVIDIVIPSMIVPKVTVRMGFIEKT